MYYDIILFFLAEKTEDSLTSPALLTIVESHQSPTHYQANKPASSPTPPTWDGIVRLLYQGPRAALPQVFSGFPR